MKKLNKKLQEKNIVKISKKFFVLIVLKYWRYIQMFDTYIEILLQFLY